MKVGVFSDAIGGGSPEEVAYRSRAAGVETVQLRLCWEGLDLAKNARDRARVRRAYAAAGVEIAALAAYTNLLAPDSDRRRAHGRYFEHVLAVAQELGTGIVVTESGSYHPTDIWSDHPHNGTAAAWADLVAVTTAMTRHAERHDAIVAYEPYVANVLASAQAARRLAEDVGSAALAFVFDPAGLMCAESLARNHAIIQEALGLLAGRIALAHADDVHYAEGQAHWLPLGWGDLDAAAVLDGLVGTGYDGALIVEHLTEAQVPEALTLCRKRLPSPGTMSERRGQDSPAGRGGD